MAVTLGDVLLIVIALLGAGQFIFLVLLYWHIVGIPMSKRKAIGSKGWL